MPRLDRFGDIAWKRPTIETITSILKNPAYAGAFVYGRNSHTTTRGPQGNVVRVKRLEMEKWRILIKDKYPAYVGWETFERIQVMLKDNHAEYERKMTRGVPREGKALLAGLALLRRVLPQDGGSLFGSDPLPLRLPQAALRRGILPEPPGRSGGRAGGGGLPRGALPGGTGPLREGDGRSKRDGRRRRARPPAATRASTATRPSSPADASSAPTRTTASSPQSWRGDGRSPCAN